MTIREKTEALEREILSPYAALAASSRGRERPEEPCPIRTDYQRDRDRIIHGCKSFRRLSYKTQVFISPSQDHIRTRMTHTLEVSQIGRTLARALRLNEDLTEAIALGHDLGHTPFGHAGEYALDQVLREYVPGARFRHNEQSLRVVDKLEKDGQGVNLTFETRDGILHHSKGEADIAPRLEGDEPYTLEGKIIRWADRIAYVNHDIDDAIRAGVICEADLPREAIAVLGDTHSRRISTIVLDIVKHSEGKPYLEMSAEVCRAFNLLKDFLFARVYKTPECPGELEREGQQIVRDLFRFYMEHPENAPFLSPEQRELGAKERAQLTCDYVAGMTDRFAKEQHRRLFSS